MSTGTPDAEASHFRDALTRLANDSDYRAKATDNPVLLTQDYHLSDKDLQALRQVATMSGADTSQIDKVVSDWSDQQEGAGLKDVNVTVSCCCCCCCGETGSVVSVA